MQLNMVWCRVKVLESQQHTTTKNHPEYPFQGWAGVWVIQDFYLLIIFISKLQVDKIMVTLILSEAMDSEYQIDHKQ